MACVRRSVLLYGCKSWPNKQSDLKFIQAFANRCSRHILHRRTITTLAVELLNTARLTPLAKPKTIQARRLKWLGAYAPHGPKRNPQCSFRIRTSRQLAKATRRCEADLAKDHPRRTLKAHQTPPHDTQKVGKEMFPNQQRSRKRHRPCSRHHVGQWAMMPAKAPLGLVSKLCGKASVRLD